MNEIPYLRERSVDPRDLERDVWLPYIKEEYYSTYLKCDIWITDGRIVEGRHWWKEVPFPDVLSNGKYSVRWMLPGDKYDGIKPEVPALGPFDICSCRCKNKCCCTCGAYDE